MSADKLLKIQNTLDDIKEIMYKNIEEVLKRGDKLDDLVDKSTRLSDSSKIFYKTAKKQIHVVKLGSGHEKPSLSPYLLFSLV